MNESSSEPFAQPGPGRVARFSIAAALFALLVAAVLAGGADRSAWVLMTQPLETLHAANGALGYSYVRDGLAFHKENLSTFRQVAFFSGAEVAPDLYFRRPVYTWIAALGAPVAGVSHALLLANLFGWALGAWLCHRFTKAFYGDALAAWWAGLFAAAGTGFVLHALDLSAHLLAFVFYMAGVASIHRSQVWRRRAGARVHAAIALFLALACLQYNTGIALVAAYFVVAVRHNPLPVVAACAGAAALAQPLWGAVIGAVHAHRFGLPLQDLSATELAYLRAALEGWLDLFRLPAGEMVAAIAALAASFAFFAAPFVTVPALARMAGDARDPEGRARLAFALPFIAFPLLAALVFAPRAPARGYLVFGIAIFFFAACGALVAGLQRRRGRAGTAAGAVLLALSIAWAMAHLANVLGPAKAYFLGMDRAAHLFVPGAWEAVSLTGLEPTPRAFGGGASLAEAGLSEQLPLAGVPRKAKLGYSVAAGALFAILVGLLLAVATPLGWRAAALTAAVLAFLPSLGARMPAREPRVAITENLHRVPPGDAFEQEVAISDALRARLAAALEAGGEVLLYSSIRGVPPKVRIGEAAVALAPGPVDNNWRLESGGLRRALAASGLLRVSFAAPSGFSVSGWQRPDLEGRRAVLPDGTAPRAAPALELRLVRRAGEFAPVLLAF